MSQRADNGGRLYASYVAVEGPLSETLDTIAQGLPSQDSGVWKLTGDGDLYLERYDTCGGRAGAGRQPNCKTEQPRQYLMTRIFQGDKGVWYVAYLVPASAGNREQGRRVARATVMSTRR